jgi:hypothetical protein
LVVKAPFTAPTIFDTLESPEASAGSGSPGQRGSMRVARSTW